MAMGTFAMPQMEYGMSVTTSSTPASGGTWWRPRRPAGGGRCRVAPAAHGGVGPGGRQSSGAVHARHAREPAQSGGHVGDDTVDVDAACRERGAARHDEHTTLEHAPVGPAGA